MNIKCIKNEYMSIHTSDDDIFAWAEKHTQDTNAAFVITSDNIRDYQAFAASHRCFLCKKKTHPLDMIQSDVYTLRKKVCIRKNI